MSRILLDTSAYSAFKRGHTGVVASVRRAREILLPITVLGELLAGFETGTRKQANEEELHRFLQSPRVSIARLLEATARRYAVIYADLRRAGRPVPTNDMWIAASAMEHGAELLTTDDDFTAIARVLVRHFSP